MPTKDFFEEVIPRLPKATRDAIAVRTSEMLAEEASLRDLRTAHERSQAEIAEQLGVNQAAVSKMERRTDMYLSTLRGYIEAMGGKLEIIARFPHQAVRIMQFESLDPEERPQG